jgi:orotate phosphoribosyltransferase-like protein
MSDNSMKYAVYHLDDQSMSISDIAKELGVTSKRIQTILKNRIKLEKQEETKQVKPKDLIINETSGKRTKNVSIMTQAASMMSDQLKENLTAPAKSDRMDGTSIFRPLDNK